MLTIGMMKSPIGVFWQHSVPWQAGMIADADVRLHHMPGRIRARLAAAGPRVIISNGFA
jgi:hypothetical protein